MGPNGKLWLFGGYGPDASGSYGDLNDLWSYDTSTGQWTWEGGSKSADQAGSYGTQGMATASNMPGGRYDPVGWVGPKGKLWLFGGYGYESRSGYEGDLNDMWSYNIATDEWTWHTGSQNRNDYSIYGTPYNADSGNKPSGRGACTTWIQPDGKFWLFGGSSQHADQRFQQLWSFNPVSKHWAYYGGSYNVGGTYGTKGELSQSNMIGSRSGTASWTTPDGHVWFFGGEGRPEYPNPTGSLNDLWLMKFDPGMLSFEGYSFDYAKVADAPELDVSNAMSLEAWVKFNDVSRSGTGEDWMSLVMKGDDSSAYGLMLNVSTSDKTLRFVHQGASTNATDYNWTDVSIHTWYHVAATYDGSTAKIYIDGVEQASESVSGSIATTSDSLFFGKIATGDYKLDAIMGEVRLWSKALTKQEIENNMNLSVSGTEQDLAGAWLPRSGGQRGAIEQSGSGNDLILGNVEYAAEYPPIASSITGGEGWRTLGAPGDTTSYVTLLKNVWTQGFSGSDGGTNGDSNVYYYNETTHGWDVPANASNITGTSSDAGDGLGKGILTYVYADDNYDGTDDPFPKKLQLQSFGKSGNVEIPLSYTDTGNSSNDGWHLVANPYPLTIYWQQVVNDGRNQDMLDYVYVWDQSLNSGAGGYRTYYPGGGNFDGRIPAFQSFWVKAEQTGASLKFTSEDFTNNQMLYKQMEVPKRRLPIKMDGEGFQDVVSVIFPKDRKSSFQPVPKLRSLSERHAELYLTDDRQQRWITQNVIPGESKRQWELPLNVDATVPGTYSLNWDLEDIPSDWTIFLEDNKNGQRIDLRGTNFYEFSIDGKAKKEAVQSKKLLLPPAPGTSTKAKEGEPIFTLHISTTALVNQHELPDRMKLYQNFPNPFNPTTSISYDVPQKSNVRLAVYDMLGRQVATLVNGQKTAGHYELNFDAHNFASGTYIYRLQVGAKIITKKMTLIK